jgi:hypothetical protein
MAGAGAGARAVAATVATAITNSELSNEADVFGEMQAFFKELYDNLAIDASVGKAWSFTLGIKASNGKTYRTTFRAIIQEIENTITKMRTRKVNITNECIVIFVFPTTGKPEEANLSTEIKANRGESACFEPRLVSNGANVPKEDRITATDLLQVLKLKLSMAQPIDANRIDIYDAATIKNTRMTPFRLLRGMPPFYEKYGYVNDFVAGIQTRLSSLTLGDLRKRLGRDVTAEEREAAVDIMEKDDPTRKELAVLLKVKIAELFKDKEDSDLLIDAMKTLTLEDEESVYQRFSFDLFTFLFSSKMADGALEFKFDPDSAAWRHWKDRVVLTSFRSSPVGHEGGRRRLCARTSTPFRKRSSRKTKKAGRQ